MTPRKFISMAVPLCLGIALAGCAGGTAPNSQTTEDVRQRGPAITAPGPADDGANGSGDSATGNVEQELASIDAELGQLERDLSEANAGLQNTEEEATE